MWPDGLQPARLLCPWDSPGKNTGVGFCALLLWIFLTHALAGGFLPVASPGKSQTFLIRWEFLTVQKGREDFLQSCGLFSRFIALNKYIKKNWIFFFRLSVLFIHFFLCQFFFLTKLLQYNCFTMLCLFLLCSTVNQLCIYTSHTSALWCAQQECREPRAFFH